MDPLKTASNQNTDKKIWSFSTEKAELVAEVVGSLALLFFLSLTAVMVGLYCPNMESLLSNITNNIEKIAAKEIVEPPKENVVINEKGEVIDLDEQFASLFQGLTEQVKRNREVLG